MSYTDLFQIFNFKVFSGLVGVLAAFPLAFAKQILNFKFFSGLAGVLAAFPLAFAKMLGLNLKNACIKTARANKVLKSRNVQHNIAIDKC